MPKRPKRDAARLHEDTRRLMADIALVDGHLRLPGERVAHWRAALAGVEDQHRRERAVEILGVAVKLRREGGSAAADAVEQLCELAAILVDSLAEARALLDDVAARAERAQRRFEEFSDSGPSARAPSDKPPVGTMKAGALGPPRRKV